MSSVHELAFAHPVVVFDGGDHWSWVTAEATAPVSQAGVTAFIRYRDAVAERYGYLTSTWATTKDGAPYVGVLVYGIDGAASGTAPTHPSGDPRFRQLAEAYATTDPDAARHLAVAPAPGRPLLWARTDDALVPVAVNPGVGLEHVAARGAGLPLEDQLLTRVGVREEIERSPLPVAVPVHPYTHRDREKVAARIAAGRAEPALVLTVGTIEQFAAAGST